MGGLELSLKSIFYLVITGLIGWIVGFFLGRIFGSANATELLKESESRLRLRDQDLKGLRTEVAAANETITSLQTNLLSLATTINTREQWISEMEAKQKELQEDLEARISELDELKAETDQEKAVLHAQLTAAIATAKAEAEAWKVRVAEAEGAAKLVAHTERELRAQLKNRETELTQVKVQVTELEMMAREVKEMPVKVSSASTVSTRITEQDDLKKVFGIGPTLEKLLNQNGIYLFRQIAEWSQEDVQRYDNLLEQFRGRIEREGWIASAKEQHLKKYGEQL